LEGFGIGPREDDVPFLAFVDTREVSDDVPMLEAFDLLENPVFLLEIVFFGLTILGGVVYFDEVGFAVKLLYGNLEIDGFRLYT
jgi:hypothetical protein